MPLRRDAQPDVLCTSGGGQRRRSLYYVKPAVGSTSRLSEHIGDRSRRVV